MVYILREQYPKLKATIINNPPLMGEPPPTCALLPLSKGGVWADRFKKEITKRKTNKSFIRRFIIHWVKELVNR